MDPELSEADMEALNKLADDVEKLNKQMRRFEESRRLQAESRANKLDRRIDALERMVRRSQPEPLFEDQSTQPENPSQVSIPEVAACGLDDPSDVKVDRSNDDDQVSSDLLLSSDSVLIEVAPKTKQTPYLILELQKEVISEYFTINYSSVLLDDEVVMELDETHELKLTFSFSNLNLILCSPSVCQYVYMDWTSYLAMRGNSVCNQGYLLRLKKKMRFGKPPAKPPDDVVICAGAEAYSETIWNKQVSHRVWLQSEVVKWEYANCGVIVPFLLPPAKPPDECLSLQEYNIWCWTKCWDLALSSIQKGQILSSNWQGRMKTIKADAKGSKEEIYSSRVKCVVKKDKPHKWVPEDDLHNVNDMLDERSSFSVTTPFPNVEFIAGGATQNSIKFAQWMLQVPGATSFMGSIGKNKYGEEMEKNAKIAGVNVLYYKDENWALGEKAKYYYIAGCFLTVSPKSIQLVAQHAAANNKVFSMNLSAPFICEFFRDVQEKALPHIGYVFCNETEARTFTKVHGWKTDDVEEIAIKISQWPKASGTYKRITVITQGADPVVVAGMNDMRYEYGICRFGTTFISAGFGAFLARYINNFFMFSLPRPPEMADLEDKVNFKGRGMLRTQYYLNKGV